MAQTYAVTRRSAKTWGVYYLTPKGNFADLLSTHDTEEDANAAKRRYEASDKRRVG